MRCLTINFEVAPLATLGIIDQVYQAKPKYESPLSSSKMVCKRTLIKELLYDFRKANKEELA